MKNILLWLWQFPQHILGVILSAILDCEKNNGLYFFKSGYLSSFSLGNYIFINQRQDTETTRKHEFGHSIQSKYLGVFYLILIGLPSVIGNMIDRVFHKKWTKVKRIKWYYSQPWEKAADKLGRVNRMYCQ